MEKASKKQAKKALAKCHQRLNALLKDAYVFLEMVDPAEEADLDVVGQIMAVEDTLYEAEELIEEMA